MASLNELPEDWRPLAKLLRLGMEHPRFRPLLWVGAGTSVAAG